MTLALSILFFCSGTCALIYQVLWLRTLGWVFGVTIYAVSTVWAMFMAGLAIGSFAAGRFADRVRRPLVWFGCAELLIGATALATPAVLAWLQRGYVTLYSSLPHGAAALTAARVVMAFAVLIVPTALMGATLPLVLKASTFKTSTLGKQVGLLYASNTAGAIIGTLVAGLYLIPQQGISSTFALTAALNLTIGVTAIALSTRLASAPHEAAPSPMTAAEVSSRGFFSDRRLLVVLAVFTVSGAVGLALEVVWFRVLTLFLRPTVYGFAAMLATILTGIAIGSYAVTPLLNRRLPWLPVLAALEVLLGVAIILSFRPLVFLPQLSGQLTPMVAAILPEYLGYPITGALLAMFPASLLMGLAFPIGLHLWASGRPGSRETSARAGLFYSLNVAAAIVGSLAAGFVLLPRLGSHRSLVVLASLSVASGLALISISGLSRAVRWGWAALTLLLAAGAVWMSPDPFVQFIAQRYPGQPIIWREEGVEATVAVHEGRSGERMLTVNGNHEASTGGAMAYVHRRIGHLPMAIHPNPRRALVIGLGGGATAGAVSLHEGVSVDVVELSQAVVRGARFFETINYGVLTRPNVRVQVDDGRNYMMLTPNRYDVITADVIIPIFAGSGNLYSVEYFQLMKRVLASGGLVLQWVAGTEAEYKTIVRTFLSVFPETTAWVGGGLLVGSLEPLKLRRADFDGKLNSPGRAQGLKDLGVETFDRLLSVFTAGPAELRAFVGPGPLLTDDRPIAEYFLSLPRERDPDLAALKGDVTAYVVAN